MNHKARAFLSLIFIMGLFSIMSACGQNSDATSINHPGEEVFPVDKSFREYYRSMGGADLLGPTITESFAWNDSLCQYTENALMCFNHLAKSTDRFSLFPIGGKFKTSHQPTFY